MSATKVLSLGVGAMARTADGESSVGVKGWGWGQR